MDWTLGAVMSNFVDRALLALHEPTGLATLLTGGGPAPYPRLERLVSSVFQTDSARIDDVQGVTIDSTEPLVWITSRSRVRGTLTTSQPAYSLAEMSGDITHFDGPWAHLLAHLSVQLSIAVDPGGIDSVVMTSIENITSLDDFASRFRYLDLPAFLAAHKITTVEQLRDAAQYILAEVRLRQPPTFDPSDPANTYDIPLDLAVTILEEVDLAAGLVAARELMAAGTSHPPGQASAVLGAARLPFAVAVVFPAAPNQQPTPDAVDALYAKAGVLPLFANPP